MSNINIQNPYEGIGAQISAGLAAIINTIPLSPTVDDLVDAVYGFIQPIYYPSANAQVTLELKSVAYNAINSYGNNLVLSNNAFYSSRQMQFIQLLIGRTMFVSVAPDSFKDRLQDIQDNIGISSLSVEEQTPLFIADSIGSSAHGYWVQQLALGTGSNWVSHFSTNGGQNYLNTLQWCVAAMNGALAGYGANVNGMIEPTTNSVSAKMISALIGALTLSSGKVIFNWIPKIKVNDLSIKMNVISSLANSGTGRVPGSNPQQKPAGGGNTKPPVRDHDTPTWKDGCNFSFYDMNDGVNGKNYPCGHTILFCVPSEYCGQHHGRVAETDTLCGVWFNKPFSAEDCGFAVHKWFSLDP